MLHVGVPARWCNTSDTEGIRTHAGRAKLISSPSPSPLGHNVMATVARDARQTVQNPHRAQQRNSDIVRLPNWSHAGLDRGPYGY